MKIEKTTIIAFVAVTFIFGLFTTANASPTNLIVNGSFEEGPDPGRLLVLPLGSTSIDGWKVTRDAIDYKGTFWVASDGDRSLDLDNSPGFGGIEQTFATMMGKDYVVTFDMAGNPYSDFSDPPIKYMRVEAAGQYADFSFDVTGHDYLDMGWVTRSWQFTANATSTALEFYTLDTFAGGYSGYCGPTLDNVSVSIVPEPVPIPAPGALLLGSIGVVFVGYLRRRRIL